MTILSSWAGRSPASHYDDITDAWRYIMGDNFHFGYFESPTVSLIQATETLIDKLAERGNIDMRSKILDIGCGIGAPAFYLYNKYRCSIVGISTSQRGVDIARARGAEMGIDDKVEFILRDGTDTGFSNHSYNVAWILESSHLMNKQKLFSETYRVLKPKGQLLLCDLMLLRKPTVFERGRATWRLGRRYLTGSRAMRTTFARGEVVPFNEYYRYLLASRFRAIEIIDISDKVVPTLGRWREAIKVNRSHIMKFLSPDQLDAFFSALLLLRYLFLTGIMRYGIIKATKE